MQWELKSVSRTRSTPLVRIVRKLPMTWSPVTESNRRPSPYHGHPSALTTSSDLQQLTILAAVSWPEGSGSGWLSSPPIVPTPDGRGATDSATPAPGACCSTATTGCWPRGSCGPSWSPPPGNFPAQTRHREDQVPDMPDPAVRADDPPARNPPIQPCPAVTPAGTMNPCGPENDSAHRDHVPRQAVSYRLAPRHLTTLSPERSGDESRSPGRHPGRSGRPDIGQLRRAGAFRYGSRQIPETMTPACACSTAGPAARARRSPSRPCMIFCPMSRVLGRQSLPCL